MDHAAVGEGDLSDEIIPGSSLTYISSSGMTLDVTITIYFTRVSFCVLITFQNIIIFCVFDPGVMFHHFDLFCN